MNTCLRVLVCVLIVSGSLFSAELYPRQRNLQNAHNKLMSAKAHLVRSQNNKPQMHLTEASVDLSAAHGLLETAKKNKGSNRLAAMKAIEAAQAEIVKLKAGGSGASTAIQHVDDALKEVAQSAKAGR